MEQITSLEKYINGVLILIKNVNTDEQTVDSLSIQCSLLNELSNKIDHASLSMKKLLDIELQKLN